MATIVTRSGKGSPLTHAEVDSNFTNLNTDKLELSGGTMTGNLSFGDNDKAIFGAGSDLQIYHDGSNSYMLEGGTGSLILGGTNLYLANGDNSKAFLRGTDNADVALYYNNSIKLATTSTGVDITGTITSDGLTVDGTVVFDSSAASANIVRIDGAVNQNTRLVFRENGTDKWNIGSDAAADFFNIYDSVNSSNRLTVENSGDISFYEDTGTTAKFFWDASAESLGIGTSSPSRDLYVSGGAGARADIQVSYDALGTTGNDGVQFGIQSAGAYIWNFENSSTYFATNNTERMRIDSSGNVGIGTTSPSTTLEIAGSFSGSGGINITQNNGNGNGGRGPSLDFKLSQSEDGSVIITGGRIRANKDNGSAADGGAHMVFSTSNSAGTITDAMRIDSSGNVGIGTSSPSSYAKLHVDGGSGNNTNLFVTTTDNADVSAVVISHDEGLQGGLTLSSDKTNGVAKITTNNSSFFPLVFEVRGSDGTNERMRIDSSGNLLVGKTSTAFGTAGNRLLPDGGIYGTKDGAAPFAANRLTSDGDIMSFWKDTTPVGSIGARGDDLTIGTGDVRLRFNDSADEITPRNSDDTQRDAAVNIGKSTIRFKDLYLSGGVYLGGTVAANKLDDYEEGSVTLTMGGGTSNPSTTQSTTGQYIKVGSLVTVWFKFSNKDNTGASGVVEIDGLPFTVTSLLDGYGTAWGGRDSAGGTGHKVYLAGNGTTSAKMIDGSGNNVTWSSTGSATYQGGMITYRT